MFHIYHPATMKNLYSSFNFNHICLAIFVQRELMFARLKLNDGYTILAESTSKKFFYHNPMLRLTIQISQLCEH